MNTSAPQPTGRSQSASSDSVFVSPSTKRQHVSSSNTPVLASFPGNDDEQERKQRRRSRVIDLQLSSTDSPLSVQSPSSRPAETSLPVIPKLTNTQISDHYSTCIKLSTENRITTKNAFGLHLIDYMAEILKQKDSELTNFKIAAGTLDASTKIYAVRVDAVHADVYKVLGGLGKDSAATKDVDSQGADGAAAGTEAAKKLQTKKKHSYKTIEQNLNNINVSEADRRSEVDPMFQKTAASFDECSTVGIFLSTLHTHSYRCELLLDSKVTPLPSSETLESPSSTPVKVADLKSILLQCIEQRPICPTLSGFQISHWDSDSHNESVSALLDRFKKSDQVFDINAEADCDPEDCADALVEDDFDADMPDRTVAGDVGEFSDKREACRMVRESMSKDVIPLAEGDIGTMCLHLSVKPGEYSYFSPRTMLMWAGPEHWRFKPHHKLDRGAENGGRKRNIKKVFELNFDEDIDFTTRFRKTRAATTLAKSTLDNQNKKSTTLPEDFHYDPDNIIRLSLKPAIKLWRKALQSSSSDQEDEIGEYDYNNPNDTSNFCPALKAADSDDDLDPIDFMGQGGPFELTVRGTDQFELSRALGVDITTYGESNLVAEPQKVNKIEIHYAKTAKKMDMKRLKRTMWDLLTDVQKDQVGAEQNEVAEKEIDSVTLAGKKVFSGITKDLLHRLPSVMAQNLSVPLAFACLLHLANEKNLMLEGVEDLSDVLVKQGD
ncbi:condensin complex subunit 2 isoform X1 [Gopherus flavomarginatus]|uniref:condensin complex subunit 2 isoform X1 n=1 Tax=Gopherus flavomarginatus TaxID=286002 RepID=UPI0021CBE84A|nr:condensin complex subunit 2 isoform X1 [Gopherus flavomarginatus]